MDIGNEPVPFNVALRSFFCHYTESAGYIAAVHFVLQSCKLQYGKDLQTQMALFRNPLTFLCPPVYNPCMLHGNLPLRKKAYAITDAWLTELEHLPNGLPWLFSLPRTGHSCRHALRKRCAIRLIHAFFPATFLHALVLAALSSDGIPDTRGRLVYRWLLENVYAGDEAALYRQWQQLQRTTHTHPQ